MNKKEVYIELIALFEKEWNAHRPDGGPKLSPVGQNRKGVYQGYPITIYKFPCLGIMPASGDQGLIGSQNSENIKFELDIYFYAFDFHKEKSARLILDMDATIDSIIKNNRTLKGTVTRMIRTTTEYGDYIRRNARGGELIAFGGNTRIIIEDMGCR